MKTEMKMKDEKHNYIAPIIRIVFCGDEDVIRTSGSDNWGSDKNEWDDWNN